MRLDLILDAEVGAGLAEYLHDPGVAVPDRQVQPGLLVLKQK